MGGIMSGSAPMTDAEKIAKGTFDKRWSAEAITQRKAEKVITGRWLTNIPPPSVGLNPVGLAEYNRLAQALLDINRLTEVTQRQAQMAAVAHQQMSRMLEEGKMVPMSMLKLLDNSLKVLGLAESAKNIGPAPKATDSKWGLAGFANRKK